VTAPDIPAYLLRPYVRAYARGDAGIRDERLSELARASALSIRRLKAIMRAEPDSIPAVDFWAADRLLVATDNVAAWRCNPDLAALYTAGLTTDVEVAA
jgi:hypothetical protein